MTLWLTSCLWLKTFSLATYQTFITFCIKEVDIQNVCHYPTDLVLDDVVADTVLVVKDLLMSTSIKHSSYLA